MLSLPCIALHAPYPLLRIPLCTIQPQVAFIMAGDDQAQPIKANILLAVFIILHTHASHLVSAGGSQIRLRQGLHSLIAKNIFIC